MSYFTLRWLKNNNVAKTPYGIGNYLGPGQSVLSFIASRSSFLIGELLLGNLSETVVVVGNAPHDRPSFLVGHLVGNRASLLCTKAPMLRVPETNFLHGITSIALTEFPRPECIFWTRPQPPLGTIVEATASPQTFGPVAYSRSFGSGP